MPGWMLALHLIGIILWMGGLFMLTRHTGTHAGVESQECRDIFRDYEKKSYYMAVLPGFVLTLLTGLYALLANPAHYLKADGTWGATFHAKLTLIVVLIAVDQFFHFRMRKLHRDGEGGRGLFMGLHGTIGLIFITIVFLMEAKPLV